MNPLHTLPSSPAAAVSPDPVQTEPLGPAAATGDPAPARRRVLVVDDHPLLRYGLIYALTGEGYECFGAEHGTAALAVLSTTAVDLVVTDLSMPRMGGLELIGRMASSPALHSVPVILVTGSLDEETRVRALKAGAKAALQRSARPDDMLDAIRSVLLGASRPGS